MNWQDLYNHFEKTYEFLDRIHTSNSSEQQNIPIHPLLKLTTGIALKAITSEAQNKLVILFPNSFDSARWIATLCTLEIIKNDFDKHSLAEMKFVRGQKLLLNKCVVEFDREEFLPEQKKSVMFVKTKEGTLYGARLDREITFQSVSTDRPLSSFNRFVRAYKLAPKVNNQIDAILGIKALGNRTIFSDNLIIISKIGDTEDFVNKIKFNSIKIADLFLCGKLNVCGNEKIIGSDQIKANPSCLVSSDLFGASDYITNNPYATKGIIIDGSRGFANELQIFDDKILNNNIPTIVIMDMSDAAESLHHLEERGFKVWQWNKKNIIESNSVNSTTQYSPFYSFENSLSNYCTQEITTVLCEYPELEEIIKKLFSLDKAISNEHQQLKESFSKLFQCVNKYSRLIRLPSPNWYKDFQESILLIHQEFNRQKMWLAEEVIQTVDFIFSTISGLLARPFSGKDYKIDKFDSLINCIPCMGVTAVVVPEENDILDSANYWTDKFPKKKMRKIHFLTINNLKESYKDLKPFQIIICGWLGGPKMSSILHSYIAPKITLLLYSFESRWYNSALSKWRQNNHSLRAKDFAGMLGFSEKKLKFINFELNEPIVLAHREALDILGFELKITNYRYAQYINIGEDKDEVSKVKLLVFSQSKFSFVTESHKLLVITDMMRGKKIKHEIPRKFVNELKVSDYVLFRESDKDIIREIADKGLENKGLSNLREDASLWNKVLHAKYKSFGEDMDKLIELLDNSGCKRHPSTIKNWLFGNDIIGPGHNDDLLQIARATNSALLNENISKVQSAISKVRGAHHQASTYLTQKLSTLISEMFEGEQSFSDIHKKQSIEVDLEEFGKITILRIEEIRDEWAEVETKWANRLLTHEIKEKRM